MKRQYLLTIDNRERAKFVAFTDHEFNNDSMVELGRSRRIILIFLTLLSMCLPIFYYFKNHHLISMARVFGLPPKPIVFSRKFDSYKLYYNIELSAHLKNGETIDIDLGRNFYQNIGGPHQYKVYVYRRLHGGEYFSKTSMKRFLRRYFCEGKAPLTYVHEIESVSLKRPQLNQEYSIKCLQ